MPPTAASGMIFPTDKSRKAFGEIKGVAGEVYEQAMAGLSREERLAMVRGLATIVENLSAAETAAETELSALKGSAA